MLDNYFLIVPAVPGKCRGINIMTLTLLGFSVVKRGEGKIEGRHILIIALSEHHRDVDYMNRKGWSLRYYAGGGGGGAFSPMCTSDSIDSCMAPGLWQTLISIAEVRMRYCSEIESCKSKPIDQKFLLFCVATRHSR